MINSKKILIVLNIIFFIGIAFVAGYNLRIHEEMNQDKEIIKLSIDHIRMANENFEKSEKIYDELINQIDDFGKPVIHAKNSDPGSNPVQQSFTNGYEKMYEMVKSVKDIVEKINVTQDKAIVLHQQNTKPEPIHLIDTVASPPDEKTIQKDTVSIENKQKTKADKIASPANRIGSSMTKDKELVDVLHIVEKGEFTYNFLLRYMLKDFMAYNNISDVKRLIPGQKVLMKIPKQMVESDTYMKDYTIVKDEDVHGKIIYILVKRK